MFELINKGIYGSFYILYLFKGYNLIFLINLLAICSGL